MEGKSIAIAVIGTGIIGPRHAKSVAECPNATLLCIVDPSPSARDVAASFDVPLFASVSEMLQGIRRPDAAIVCTPNSTHVAISKELLEAGIHVLVEKPFSTTISSGRELVESAKSSGKHLLVGHHRRFNPYTTATKRALADGIVGQVIAVSGLWATYKPPAYFRAPTEWRATTGSGGPILINLIHEVDLLQYLLGPITRVHAEQTLSQRGHEAEEGAAILLRFASGVVGTFILSDCTPSPYNFEAATGENPLFPKAGKDVYRIFGAEGTLSVGDMKVHRYGEGKEKSWTSELDESTLEVGDEIPFDEQVKHLVRVVWGEEQPRCTGEDGLRAVVVCDAIKRALIQGGAVDVE
ncbi:hypothetical protein LTR36_000691 [Oleoguttula mirabilis]|uniref:Oxidoreductase n=1 Tax=Oleoguttula mirabilis TaxID=1507867 RepID=A0AAV9JQM5_9PEZI|nr:hypothetical protein LTR36_000691 [Oleoguttula mirabilis]